MGWEKIADIFAWAVKKLPLPDRVEGIKNEIDKLEKERSAILVNNFAKEKARRLVFINARLDVLRDKLRNIAKD